MDALTFLRQDHEAVLGMLEVLEDAPARPGPATEGLDTLVTNLVIAESRHEAIEEQLFWPEVRRALDDGDALADHAVEQEQLGKQLLQRLDEGSPGEPAYHAALQEFVQLAREHIRFEQDVVWPRVRAAVDPARLEEIGENLLKAKEVAPTRPHPNTPPGGAAQLTMGTVAGAVDHVRDRISGRHRKNPPDPQIR
ncbi:hemerythrin domain-containing protein [uncultured Mycolicibacterium sp.]|uniref:hemerythrin domain-containing protein n=1 Tax=uncultured Mycolicibacterium sp. TaxID=2320817 RepID=UPI002616DF3B|nr:hemerythrin domain-containing protein [uncultured Mycolicibacterium sp.]